MKKFTIFLCSSAAKYSALVLIAITGLVMFQAQDFNQTGSQQDNAVITDSWRINSDNLGPQHPPQPMVVVTTPDGYDNFNMGLDNAESSIAVHPSIPTWFANGWNGNPLGIAGTHHTEDGGDPWAINNPTLPSTYGDPWMAYDSLGNLFYINLNGSGPTGTWVVKSTNNGLTWGTAVSACTGNDRENIAADQTGGPYANYIYCGETTSGGASFYRSTDHGASFQSMVTLTPHSLPGFMCCVGPNGGTQGGSVYAVTYAYSTLSSQYYTIHRSTNGGTSFTQMSQITGIGFAGIDGGSGRGSINGQRTRAYPMIAADNSYGPYRGRVYVCWANNPNNGQSGLHSDILLKYSTDFGATWSATVTVNDDPNTTTSDQWFPAIWCDKNDNGKLYCKWYSTEDNPATFSTYVMGSYSTNGGATWTSRQKISNQPFPYPNVGPCSGCVTNYRGDYDGIVSNGKTSMSAWFDGRSATWASYSGYFPDFAMKVNPAVLGIGSVSDSGFSFVSVPGVKLYTDKVKFTATVSPTPGAGTLTMSFINKTTAALQDSLTAYPDSVRFRVKSSGSVTPGAYTVTITGKGSNGTPIHKRTIALTVNPLGITSNNNQIPKDFSLMQNYPNPFNPTTSIRFDLPKASLVKLVVYDIAGKVVETIADGIYNAGIYSVSYDASKLSSGIYFYKLETESFTSVKKMMLIK
jgi:hypothetical protein